MCLIFSYSMALGFSALKCPNIYWPLYISPILSSIMLCTVYRIVCMWWACNPLVISTSVKWRYATVNVLFMWEWRVWWGYREAYWTEQAKRTHNIEWRQKMNDEADQYQDIIRHIRRLNGWMVNSYPFSIYIKGE